MPAFKAPPGKNAGYDVQNGALWRVRIPAAESLDVVLTDGADLNVQSNNPGIIRTPLPENNQGGTRTMRLIGAAVGTTMLEARRNGTVVTYLQVQVTPKSSATSGLIEFDLDPDSPPGEIRFHVSDPKQNAKYIDKVVTAVGYSIYLGGYHVYCQGLDLPILVPEDMVDFGLASAETASSTVFDSRENALAVANDIPSKRSVAYFWGAGGAVVCPTIIGPATTPQLYSTIIAAREQLAKEVQEQLVILAITMVGAMIARSILTRITKVRSGGNEPPRPNPGESQGSTKIKPLNGQVSIGGGFENPNGTNLNPIKPDSGGPTKGIPNHVLGGMEDMAEKFETGSVQKMISSRLRYIDVDWPNATKAAAKVMAPGGRVEMNVWCQGGEQQAVKAAFEAAKFKNVKVVGSGPGTMIYATF